MRGIMAGLAALCLGFGAVAMADEVKETPKVFKIGIDGMTWGASCAKRVREILTKLEGVDKVDVQFKDKFALVTMKNAKATLSKDAVSKALAPKYTVTSFGEHSEKERRYLLNVDGMTWASSCSKRVRAALMKLEGVNSVEVDCSKGTALVVTKAGASVEQKAAAESLKASGYGLAAFKELVEEKKAEKPSKKDWSPLIERPRSFAFTVHCESWWPLSNFRKRAAEANELLEEKAKGGEALREEWFGLVRIFTVE